MADIPTGVLKEKGKNAFEKEGVLLYIDELNSKIDNLEKELAGYEEANGAAESQLIQEYQRDLETAEKKAADAEASAQESAAQLQSANEKAAQLVAALKAEQEARSADARQMKQLLQQAQAQASSVDEEKIREYQQEIVSLRNEVGQLTSENTALKSTASSSGQLSVAMQGLQEQLTAKETEAADIARELESVKQKLADAQRESEEKETEISELNDKIAELEEKTSELEEKASEASAFAPEFDMSALYAEAQKNANQLIIKARATADKTTKDADAKATRTISEADAKAETTIREANATADKTVADAKAEADRILSEAEQRSASANAEAESILANARRNAEAESERIMKESVEREQKVRQLTSTIKSMLTIEIDGIEKSFRQASEQISQATRTMNDKMSAADAVIREARDCVDKNAADEDATIESILSKQEPSDNASFAQDAIDSFVADVSSKREETISETMTKDLMDIDSFTDAALNDFEPIKTGNSQNPAAKKDFNFDMSELIKDAEASVQG